MKIFVTGGAGYIGSHVVKTLGEKGYDILIIDDLSTGHKDQVLFGELVVSDIGNTDVLKDVIRDFKPDLVMHFAAHIQVEESVRLPFKYYENNTLKTLGMLKTIVEEGVNCFLFSSTAAVYGIPEKIPVKETAALNPINPYGTSKVCVEYILKDLSNIRREFRFISLRYFNVAGADPDGKIGQVYPEPTHLITRALKVAKGELPELQIYGTDYPTPDGTCIRDYIHVCDIAEAHVVAAERMINGDAMGVYNCGYGKGYSVREVVKTVKKVTGIDFKVLEAPRRAGDPPALVADNEKIIKELGWKPRYNDLEFIIKTAWDWENKLN